MHEGRISRHSNPRPSSGIQIDSTTVTGLQNQPGIMNMIE